MTAPLTPEALVEAPYVLLKRGLFERPGHHGYTGVLRHAGRFSHEEASAYAGHCDAVTMMLASEAPTYSPACWHETQVEDLLDLLRIEREAKDAALAALQQVTVERDAAITACAEMIRIAEMSFEEAMAEPEESGSYAAFQRAKAACEAAPGVADAAKTLAGQYATATAEAARLRAEVEALKVERDAPVVAEDLGVWTAKAGSRVLYRGYTEAKARAHAAEYSRTALARAATAEEAAR